MRVEVKGKVQKIVEETIGVDLQKYWVVRLIYNERSGLKKCVEEKEFLYEPDEQEIASFLYENHLQYGNIFATVEENYKLIHVDKAGD